MWLNKLKNVPQSPHDWILHYLLKQLDFKLATFDSKRLLQISRSITFKLKKI